MRIRRPPALATWLLDRLGYAAENPALAGDLLEEFHNGRSPAWYWRQTLTVIVKTPGRKNVAWLCSKAYLAGFVAQIPVCYCFWRFHALPMVHGTVGWTLAALFSAFAVVVGPALRVVIAGGRDSSDLKRLLWIQGRSSPVRRVAARHLLFETFMDGVLAYSIAAMFFPSDFQAIGGWIGSQIGIFSLKALQFFADLTPIGIRFPHSGKWKVPGR